MTLRHPGGHLGARTSALLDGQLPDDESRRAWAHIAGCEECHDLVEREAWLKRRLACLGEPSATSASDRLKGDLLAAPACPAAAFAAPMPGRSRRMVGVAAIGGGALGAAVLSVLTVGAAPADAPTFQRNTPFSAVTTVPTGAVGHVHDGGARTARHDRP